MRSEEIIASHTMRCGCHSETVRTVSNSGESRETTFWTKGPRCPCPERGEHFDPDRGDEQFHAKD